MSTTSLKLPEDVKQLAVAARAETLESGKGYAAADVHAWIQQRALGQAASKPKARSWRTIPWSGVRLSRS